MWVGVHICINVYAYIYMYMERCIRTHTHTPLCLCMCICRCVCRCVCVGVCVCVCVSSFVCARAHLCVNAGCCLLSGQFGIVVCSKVRGADGMSSAAPACLSLSALCLNHFPALQVIGFEATPCYATPSQKKAQTRLN